MEEDITQPMIIITEHAEAKFVKALEALRPQPEASRVIHFILSSNPQLLSLAREKQALVVEAIHRHLPDFGGQTFWCEEGDIFILAASIPTKQARDLMLEIATLLGTTVSDSFSYLYECQLHINRILALLEAKAEGRRRKALEEQKRREEAALKQKRAEILTTPTLHSVSPAELQAKRKNRSEPEILIIEDDIFSRKLVENVLKSRFKLTGLGSADVALATYQQLAPDVVFLDINLPDVTGHELLQQIIRIDPNAYVIMLSGNADKANILTAMQNGAKGFVAKPFTKDKLFQYIDRCPSIATVKA